LDRTSFRSEYHAVMSLGAVTPVAGAPPATADDDVEEVVSFPPRKGLWGEGAGPDIGDDPGLFSREYDCSRFSAERRVAAAFEVLVVGGGGGGGTGAMEGRPARGR
jgi:hypothetical protein